MKTTFQQGLGSINPKYWTALFWFELKDHHFFLRPQKDKCNWMPKHTEISEMIKGCLEVEPPDKRERLKKLWIEAIEEGINTEVIYNR